MDRSSQHDTPSRSRALAASALLGDAGVRPIDHLAVVVRALAGGNHSGRWFAGPAALVLLNQRDTVLAIALGLPPYLPFALLHLRRAVAQAHALTTEIQAWLGGRRSVPRCSLRPPPEGSSA